jgi:hypothetical protein
MKYTTITVLILVTMLSGAGVISGMEQGKEPSDYFEETTPEFLESLNAGKSDKNKKTQQPSVNIDITKLES